MKKRKDGRYEQSIKIDGKRHVFYGRTIQEVRRKMVEFQEKKEKGPLFSQVADEWQAEEEARVSYNTMKTHKARVKKIKERFKGRYMREITPKTVSSYVQSLAAKNMGYKTVAGYLSVMNMIFRKAVIDGHIDSNPAELVQVPFGLKRTQRELPSDEDIKTVIASAGKPFGLFPYLLLYTGLRKGEALALTYQDIDRTNMRITVNKSLHFPDGAPAIKHPKTAKGIRTIPLLDALADVLPKQDIGLVFPGTNGLMRAGEYEKLWNAYRKETGISCTAHQLRHGLATILFEAGVSDKDAQDILGHADIQTTRNIYTHIRDKRRELVTSKINNYISTSDFRHDPEKTDNKAT